MAGMDQRGVTLIELMVAMLLLTIALLGLAASFPYALYGVTAGGYQTTATLLAQQVIESAKGTAYGNISTLDTGGGDCTSGGTYAAVAGYDGFTRCVFVQVSNPTTYTTTVTTVVRFSGGGAGSPIYDTTLVTILAE